MKKAISLIFALTILCTTVVFPASAADIRSGEKLIEVFGFDYLAAGTNLKNVKGYGQQYRMDYKFSQTDGFGLGPTGRYEAFIASGKGYKSSKALKWLPHSTLPHSPLTIDLSADPKGVTDWSGVSEVWLYVDATEFPDTQIMFNFGLYLSDKTLNHAPANDNVPDLCLNKFGAPVYVQNPDPDDGGAWKMQAATTWRRVTLPAGFKGWVKLPVSPALFGILGKNVGDDFNALKFSYVAGLFLEMNYEWMGGWDNNKGTYIEGMPKDNKKAVYIDSISIKADESKRKPTTTTTASQKTKTNSTTSGVATTANGTMTTGTAVVTESAAEVSASTQTDNISTAAAATGTTDDKRTDAPEKSGPNWLIIGIIIGVVAIAGGGAAVFIIFKKKKV